MVQVSSYQRARYLLGAFLLMTFGGIARAGTNSGPITYSSDTSLTADVFCTDLTVNSGVVLTTNGFNIYCSGTLTNNGLIQTGLVGNGGTGANESPTGATAGGVFPNSYGASGGGGGGSAAISLGPAQISGSGGATQAPGGSGGANVGGSCGTGGPGAGGSTPSAPSITTALIQTWYSQGISNFLDGGGGGGGAGSGIACSDTGGSAGGSGAFGIYIQANQIIAGAVSAAGQSGGTGGSAGGGGGGGGTILLAYGNGGYLAGGYNTDGGTGGAPGANGGAGGHGGRGQILILAYDNSPPVPVSSGSTVNVPAAQPYTDTGIALTLGETVTVTATGTIYIGALSNPALDNETPNGQPWPGCASGTSLPFTAPGLACWSLIAKIGSGGAPFEIGSSATFTATSAGEFYLGVNDNYYPDNTGAWTAVVVISGGSSGFIPITPCRIADTRNTPNGPFSGPSLAGGTSRDFVIPSSACNIPSTATAYSLNVAVVPHGSLRYLTLWPSGQPQPFVSTLNSDGRIKSNAAIVPAGANGAISAFATDATDLVLDINGYFVPATDTSALKFYPVTPCRVADTRNANGPLGGPFMPGGQGRTFPILSSSCGVPSGAQAYSLNLTAVPRGPLGYLTAWPTGQPQPFVSTLNAPTGTITANAAILAAGASGDIDIFTTNDTDLVVDINGYFAAPGTGGLSLYTLPPCRVLDTRNPSGTPPFTGQKDVDVTASGCGTPSTAQAYLFNATVVPDGPLGYLTLWPQGEAQPLVSTLNAVDGAITGNMAIVPTNNGSISAWAADPTYLVLDIFGYLGP